MTEENVSREWNEDVEEVRNFLREYWVCRQMLNLRRYERKRWGRPEEPDGVEALLLAGEACWMARMREVEALVGLMRNGREKLVLYYHYIRGESASTGAVADLLFICSPKKGAKKYFFRRCGIDPRIRGIVRGRSLENGG